MKKSFFPVLSFLMVLALLASPEFRPSVQANAPGVHREALKASPDFGKIPLYFVPSHGASAGAAFYFAQAASYRLWVTQEGLEFDFVRKVPRSSSAIQAARPSPDRTEEARPRVLRERCRLVFLNANRRAEVEAMDRTEHRVNTLLGNDPARWETDIPTYRSIVYKDLYPGIDLKVYGLEKEVEYDWIVEPGGDVGRIRFEYRDAQGTGIDADGNLLIRTRFGTVIHGKPESYQIVGGKRRPVEAGYQETAENTFGFKVGSFDPRYELVIDPLVLVFSTYLGGSLSERGMCIGVNGRGNVYVSGDTPSWDFPMKNAYDDSYNGDETDVYVTKFSASGKSLLFSTFLGGDSDDTPLDICVGKDGSVYLAGHSMSLNFPMKNAFDPGHNGLSDAFLARLSPDGSTLLYSTFLGGVNWDKAYEIEVDGRKNIFVAGSTRSGDFPTTNAFDPTPNGEYDAFVTKLSPNGQSLIYSTFLGGSNFDTGWGLAVDGGGRAYLTGYTKSRNFPMKNAYDSFHNGKEDIYVAVLDQAGKSLVFSTFLGGAGADFGESIAVDKNGAAFITGGVDSEDFPMKNAYDGHYNGGDYDAFAAKLNPGTGALVYSTFLGGGGYDFGWDIAVDESGACYVAGYTNSPDFPAGSGYDSSWNGDFDAFLARLQPGGRLLSFSTFFGGSGYDGFTRLVLDTKSAYLVGNTSSTDLPLWNAYDSALGGEGDALVVKFKISSAAGISGRSFGKAGSRVLSPRR